MWKRANQGERTELGGNTSLKIDQVGIPRDICKVLTKPMVVNSLNYGLAEELIREKKLNCSKRRTKNLPKNSQANH